ncbi:hypothetical protein HPP92_023502 [Vanilla planifolia]|uniref:Glycosyltransferase family 92 protein n=1 Tax=Vanilla planifolia TaxID=51239 RepID=A0A835PQ59_VANPL|nr:hypothetical protein HPP92_023502 [Vanilla planifolia]
MAVWQLQPYEFLLCSPPCPLPNSSPSLLKKKISSFYSSSSNLSLLSSSSISSPNLRTFRSYGSAAALFVQMGAYRGGANTFAVVGLASKPTHGRVYTVVVVNCTFPIVPNADNAGGRLFLYAYYTHSPRRYEKFVGLEEAPNSFSESRFHPPFNYEYLYCGSSLYGNLSASRIREWIAYHAHFFGPSSHFVFHDAGGVSAEDITAQAEYDGYYYNQFLVVNDCLHHFRHAANWTFFFDVDEYMYLPDGRTLEAVLAQLSNYTQFTIEQNPMSSSLCLKEPSNHYNREWGFEKLVFRNSITGLRRDRKYAIQAKNSFATGVHMSENVVGPTTHKTESMIRYYHYHNSINVLSEPCQVFVQMPKRDDSTWHDNIPYLYDDNMKRLAAKIKRFEDQTIGDLRDK